MNVNFFVALPSVLLFASVAVAASPAAPAEVVLRYDEMVRDNPAFADEVARVYAGDPAGIVVHAVQKSPTEFELAIEDPEVAAQRVPPKNRYLVSILMCNNYDLLGHFPVGAANSYSLSGAQFAYSRHNRGLKRPGKADRVIYQVAASLLGKPDYGNLTLAFDFNLAGAKVFGRRVGYFVGANVQVISYTERQLSHPVHEFIPAFGPEAGVFMNLDRQGKFVISYNGQADFIYRLRETSILPRSTFSIGVRPFKKH